MRVRSCEREGRSRAALIWTLFLSLEFLLSYLRTSKAHVFSHELCTVYVCVEL